MCCGATPSPIHCLQGLFFFNSTVYCILIIPSCNAAYKDFISCSNANRLLRLNLFYSNTQFNLQNSICRFITLRADVNRAAMWPYLSPFWYCVVFIWTPIRPRYFTGTVIHLKLTDENPFSCAAIVYNFRTLFLKVNPTFPITAICEWNHPHLPFVSLRQR